MASGVSVGYRGRSRRCGDCAGGRSKADPEGRDAQVYLAPDSMGLVRKWLERSGIGKSRVFRSLCRGIVGEGLGAGEVSRIFKRMARDANLPMEVVEQISGHSTRVGPSMSISIAHGMSPGTGPYTGTRPGSFGATKGQGGPRRRGYTHRTNVMRIQILSDPRVAFDGNTIPHSPPAPNSSSSPATSLRCTPAGSVTSQGAGPAPTGHSTCRGAGREAMPASAPSAERQRNGGSGHLRRDRPTLATEPSGET